jgi:peptidoglycan/xylan/chitin deacetylase (PgdA/CDA1 family)
MLLILSVFIAMIAPFYFVYKPPALLIKFFQYRWPDVLWQIATSEKLVALTIDDAPSEFTEEILQILTENDAAATFFIIGSQSQQPGKDELLKEMVRSGNELGNHAMYDEPSRFLSDADLVHQIEKVDTIINNTYNAVEMERPPRYFRPGSGIFSSRMRQQLEMLKYRLVLGNIYPHDPQIPYPKVNAAHILSMLRPGSIIICHDRRSWTVPMLRKVIPEIKRRGYHITTVSGLVNQAHIERRRRSH